MRSFDEMGRTYLPDGNVWSAIDARLLRFIPVVSAVLGSVAGLPAVNACMAHFNVMVKGTSFMGLGGPNLVKGATGEDTEAESLGGAGLHTRTSGVAHYTASDDADCLRLIRQMFRGFPEPQRRAKGGAPAWAMNRPQVNQPDRLRRRNWRRFRRALTPSRPRPFRPAPSKALPPHPALLSALFSASSGLSWIPKIWRRWPAPAA